MSVIRLKARESLQSQVSQQKNWNKKEHGWGAIWWGCSYSPHPIKMGCFVESELSSPENKTSRLSEMLHRKCVKFNFSWVDRKEFQRLFIERDPLFELFWTKTDVLIWIIFQVFHFPDPVGRVSFIYSKW